MKLAFNIFLLSTLLISTSSLPIFRPSRRHSNDNNPQAPSYHSNSRRGETSKVSVPLSFVQSAKALGPLFFSNILIGTPPTNHTLLVDTGSGLTIVGGQGPLPDSNTTQITLDIFEATFGNGSVPAIGMLVSDTVALSPDLRLQNQFLGAIALLAELDGFEGILGLSPKEATTSDFPFSANGTTVGTVLDTAFNSGLIAEEVFGLYLTYPNDLNNTDAVGELTYGGVNQDLICGDIHFVNRTTNEESVASELWGFDSSFVRLGNDTLGSNIIAVLDSGTSQISLSLELFEQYQKVTGGEVNENGLLLFTQDDLDKIQPFSFDFGGVPITLTAEDQVFSQALNPILGVSENAIVGTVNPLVGPIPGVDMILGNPLMTKFYTVYDVTNNRMGIAKAVDPAMGCL